MKNIIKVVAMAVVAVALNQSAQAVPISGAITFSGTANTDSVNANTSTEVLSWANNSISLKSGSFSSLSSSASVVLVTSWLFNSGTRNNFWVVTDGAAQYKFNLSSSAVFSTTANSITVFLAGTVISTVAGLDPTAFTGSMTIKDQGTANPAGGFSYTQSILFNPVPDGGTTVLLLGSALSGLALIRRKLSA
jgi:hypothetical protein